MKIGIPPFVLLLVIGLAACSWTRDINDPKTKADIIGGLETLQKTITFTVESADNISLGLGARRAVLTSIHAWPPGLFKRLSRPSPATIWKRRRNCCGRRRTRRRGLVMRLSLW